MSYNPLCKTCKNYFKVHVQFVNESKLTVNIKCLVNENAFQGLKLGNYKDEEDRYYDDPNVIKCTHYRKGS